MEWLASDRDPELGAHHRAAWSSPDRTVPVRPRSRASFAFESTLSGRSYAPRLKRLRESGYHIEIIFLRVVSPRLALQRIAARVKQGGHPVAKIDVLRRLVRGWKNFETVYRPLAHTWSLYDNSGVRPVLLEQGP